MSAGDGRHKLATPEERELHGAIASMTRSTVERHVSLRVAMADEAGYALKGLPFKDELAALLGISTRQLDHYGADVPITLAKAIRLCEITGDRRLLHLFAERLAAAAVPLPLLSAPCGLPEVNRALFEIYERFACFQCAAMRLEQGEQLSRADSVLIFEEGQALIRQLLRVMLLADHLDDGDFTFPLFTHLRGAAA